MSQIFFIVVLFAHALSGPCGRRGPCGIGPDGTFGLGIECECSNVLDGWSQFGDYHLDSTWKTFSVRLQKCVSWCLSVGCADTEEGAYNTCGPCIWTLWPFSDRDGCSGDQTQCCRGVNSKLYPTLSQECLCPFEKREILIPDGPEGPR